MDTPFPQKNKVYQQTDRSNVLGNLWATFNADLQSNLGAYRLAQKLVTNVTSSDNANLGRASAFAFFGNLGWYAILGTRIFGSNGAPYLTSTFTEDTSTGYQTFYDPDRSDLALYNGILWASYPNKLYSFDGSTWTDRSSVSPNYISMSGITNKLLNFKLTNRLYFIDNQFLVGSITAPTAPATSYPISVSGDYSLDLTSTGGSIQTIVATSNSIFISVMQNSSVSTTRGQFGSIFEWDGISAQPTNEYILKTAGLLSMCVINNIPYGIDTEGVILRYSGNGFDEIARLPINRNLLSEATQLYTRFVHVNGLVPTKNDTLLVGISNYVPSLQYSSVENLPSGIWEIDLKTRNITHKYSFTLKSLSSSTVTDYGQNIISAIGAITINTFSGSDYSGRSTILAGATFYTDATTTKSGLFIDSPNNPTTNTEGQKKGYFVTSFFESNEAESNWTRIWTFYRRFLDSADNIVFKYRNYEIEPIETTITWTSTTSFTTTTDVTAYAPNATDFDGTTGGEVEITQGIGGGACSHILSVVNNSGTYTVTVDETYTGASSQTAKARFQKWVKIGKVDSARGLIKAWQQLPINNSDENRIQIKCCMSFTGNGEFYGMIINSNTNVKIAS